MIQPGISCFGLRKVGREVEEGLGEGERERQEEGTVEETMK